MSSTAKNLRCSSLDFIRVVAIIGVVTQHAGFESRFDEATFKIWRQMSLAFDWCVLGFFFVSGYLYPTRSGLSFLVRKAYALLIPYLIWSLIYGLAIGLLSHVVTTLTSKFSISLFLSAGFQLYFLPYMFIVMIFASLLFQAEYWWNKYFILIVFLSVIGFFSWVGFPNYSHGKDITKLLLYFASFIFGHIFSLNKSSDKQFGFTVAIIVTSLLGIVISRGAAWPLFVSPIILLATLPFQDNINFKLLSSIGKFSGSIYLWHTPLILPCVSIVLEKSEVPSIIILMASIYSAILICIVARLILDKFWIRAFSCPLPHWISL